MQPIIDLLSPYLTSLINILIGIISTLAFYKFRRRQKDVDTSSSEFTTVKNISDEYLSSIVSMTDQIKNLHEKIVTLSHQVEILKVEIESKDAIISEKDKLIFTLKSEILLKTQEIENLTKILHENAIAFTSSITPKSK